MGGNSEGFFWKICNVLFVSIWVPLKNLFFHVGYNHIKKKVIIQSGSTNLLLLKMSQMEPLNLFISQRRFRTKEPLISVEAGSSRSNDSPHPQVQKTKGKKRLETLDHLKKIVYHHLRDIDPPEKGRCFSILTVLFLDSNIFFSCRSIAIDVEVVNMDYVLLMFEVLS